MAKKTPIKKKMTKKELRIAVAKDVLSALRTKKIKPAEGEFVRPSVCPTDLSASKKVAATIQKDCVVCNLGAMFVSLVKLDNKFQFEWLEDPCSGNQEVYIRYPLPRMRDLFSAQQLILIEHAFEGPDSGYITDHFREYDPNAEVPQRLQDAAYKFYESHSDPAKRMRAVMQNIVKNEGVFKP